VLYKRIAAAEDERSLRDLQVEMIDRFGLLPQPVNNLFVVTGLKLSASALGIRKINADVEQASIEFHANAPIDPLSLVQLVQGDPKRYRLSGPTTLRITARTENLEQREAALRQALGKLRTRHNEEAA